MESYYLRSLIILSFVLNINLCCYTPTNIIDKPIVIDESTVTRLIIRYKESSNNYNAVGSKKEIGAYQFMPYMYKRLCIIYFGKVVKPTRHNQDLLATLYIKDLYKKGYNMYQVASIWNCGKPIPNNKQTEKYIKHFKKLHNDNNFNTLLKPYNSGRSNRTCNSTKQIRTNRNS